MPCWQFTWHLYFSVPGWADHITYIANPLQNCTVHSKWEISAMKSKSGEGQTVGCLRTDSCFLQESWEHPYARGTHERRPDLSKEVSQEAFLRKSILGRKKCSNAKELKLSNCGSPWTARRSSQNVLKEIKPEYSLEGLMLKLKLQNFGHLIQRDNSLEKPPVLGKIEGRGWDH